MAGTGTSTPHPVAGAEDVPKRVSRRAMATLCIGGAVGAVVLSRALFDGEIVFPAIMGGLFGLGVAAVGKRRMAVGARDVRSIKMQRHYAEQEPQETKPTS